MDNLRGLRRWGATVAAVAAVGVVAGAGVLGVPAAAAPTELEIKASREVQGKVGEKPAVTYQITNHGKTNVEAKDVLVTVQVPGNAQLDPADFPSPQCGAIGGGRSVSCHLSGPIEPGRSVQGSFRIVLRAPGGGSGRVTVRPGNSSDSFAVRVMGGPTPTKTPTGKPSTTAEPTDASASEVVVAPPQAANGAIPQATESPTTKTSDSGGPSFGIWAGIVAIVAALGLVGSLFYFRRKDRSEPDTGMHPVVPAPAGYAPDGYGSSPPTTYGTPTTYGAPAYPPAPAAPPAAPAGFAGAAAATTVFAKPPVDPWDNGAPAYGQPDGPSAGSPPPAVAPPPPPRPGGPRHASPGQGGADETVTFRRPGSY